MELFSAEAENIKKMVGDWLSKTDHELEAKFGFGGRVDANVFLGVAQRLRAKKYSALHQEDSLTITTPDHIRFTLSSYAIIQQYCADDTLADKAFTAVIKNRAAVDSQLDLNDYDVRIKQSVESPMSTNPLDPAIKKAFEGWAQVPKGFRMIRRWTFEGDGVRFDMSIIRSTKRDKKGEFKWQRRFSDQDVLASKPRYEIEVELIKKEGDTVEEAMKRFIKGIGEVLRGIQKHSLLIRKSQKEKVLAAYKDLTGSSLFRGPSLITLSKENFTKKKEKGKPNLRDGYNVTDKADGMRCLGFVDAKGDLFLIDMAMNVYRTGQRQPELRLSLVDGEWVTKTLDHKPLQQYLIFDIIYATDKRDVSQMPFQPGAVMGEQATRPQEEDSRYFQLNKWVKMWNDPTNGAKVVAQGVTTLTKLQVYAKDYYFATAGNDSIFRFASQAWSAAKPYYTDGLIFTPNADPLPKKAAATFMQQFKWKPPRDNTIDFLAITEKEAETKTDKVTTGIHPLTGETVSYKTLRLYVGSSVDNPRDVLLNEKRGVGTAAGAPGAPEGKADEYKPILFVPQQIPDPFASVCYLPIQIDPDTGEVYVKTEDGEPIQDKTIVEMSYDPSKPAGWRWIPLRLRADKTEKLERGILFKTLNSFKVAENVWNSIYDPITESMICTGAEEPSEEELAAMGEGASVGRDLAARRYFDRRAQVIDPSIVKPMVKFHNRWIKEKILYPAGLSGEGKALLDLACGQGNDLHIWRRVGVKFVLGVDYASQNIMDPKDGAYARYLSIVTEEAAENVEPMAFVIADVSRPLVSGAAGTTEEDKDILRATFAQQKPEAAVAPYIEKKIAGKLKEKADCVSCMFAIHYFFETPEKLNGLLQNISDTLKVGGYFIGCTFDGEKVFNALKGVALDGSISGQEKDAQLWKITKKYEAEELVGEEGGFGQAIDVEFITIGMGHREYLVPFKVLQDKLALIGCELLNDAELAKIGLKNSTNDFEATWEMAKQLGQNFKLSAAAKEFSFFNRWFIFQRKRDQIAATAMMDAVNTMAASTGEAAAAEKAAIAAPRSAAAGRTAAMRNAAAATAAAATAIQKEMAEKVASVVNSVPSVPVAPGEQVRTIPVQAGPAAAPEQEGGATVRAGKKYDAGELFLFYTDAAVRDGLKIKDKGAARWLAPSAPFRIEDPEDSKILYPTVEHFMAGMRLKKASNKPELAESIFSREGTIHQGFLNDRLRESSGGVKPLSEERDHEYTKMEMVRVKDAIRPASLKKYGVILNEAKWATIKDEMLQEAIKQRWTKDARFRRVVQAARDHNKYLLYYTPGVNTSNVGGIHRKDGRIDGENRMGKIMMDLAGYVSDS